MCCDLLAYVRNIDLISKTGKRTRVYCSVFLLLFQEYCMVALCVPCSPLSSVDSTAKYKEATLFETEAVFTRQLSCQSTHAELQRPAGNYAAAGNVINLSLQCFLSVKFRTCISFATFFVFRSLFRHQMKSLHYGNGIEGRCMGVGGQSAVLGCGE